MKEHPQKTTLLNWIEGVKIEEFLSSFTDSEFQGIKLHSYYPHEQSSPNYVPPEFEEFMEETIQQWVSIGCLKEWEKVRKPNEPLIPTVVSPLGVEPSKPRALWDGRFVNEFCRDIPFSMDNASKVAEVSGAMLIFLSWTIKMVINMCYYVGIHGSFLVYTGKENIMFLLYCHLGGKAAQ